MPAPPSVSATATRGEAGARAATGSPARATPESGLPTGVVPLEPALGATVPPSTVAEPLSGLAGPAPEPAGGGTDPVAVPAEGDAQAPRAEALDAPPIPAAPAPGAFAQGFMAPLRPA